MKQRTYRVWLRGTVLPGKSRAEVLSRLAALFHSERAKMEKLLQGKPVALTKQYERAEANKIRRAIRAAGAECDVEKIIARPSSAANDEGRGEEKEKDKNKDEGFQSNDSPDPAAQRESEPEQQPEPEPSASLPAAMLRFVAVNTDYYARQFAKFGAPERPSFAVTWHWPAFFAFFFWAAYRKLWRWAGFNLLGGLVLLLMVQPGPVYVAWALCWPLTANYLYFRQVRAQVRAHGNQPPAHGGQFASRAKDANNTNARNARFKAQRGGVSRTAVWLGILLMFVISIALNNTLSERLLQQYFARIDAVLPPGSRQRGDGSVIDNIAALDPSVAKTVVSLSVLAAKLQALDTGADADARQRDQQQVLSQLQQFIERKQVKDAWGTVIAVQRELGRLVLVSAGPDASFGTPDDILQYIRLNYL